MNKTQTTARQISEFEWIIVLAYRDLNGSDAKKAAQAETVLRSLLFDEKKTPPAQNSAPSREEALAQLKRNLKRAEERILGASQEEPKDKRESRAASNGVQFGDVEASRARLGITTLPVVDHTGGHRIRSLTPAQARAELTRRERNG